MRPTSGNETFMVPLVRAWQLVQEARTTCSGLARWARFVMSHASGKIELVGVDGDHIFLRFHRARDPRDEGRVLVAKRDDTACWFDDLELVDL